MVATDPAEWLFGAPGVRLYAEILYQADGYATHLVLAKTPDGREPSAPVNDELRDVRR